jgi:hypothetical protein
MERNADRPGAEASGARGAAPMRASPILKTTRALRDVKSINDIVASESEPYDANVAARSLYDLLTATAALHPERLAMTTLAGDRSLEPLSSLTHSQLLVEVTRAANLFGAWNRRREGVVAILCPTFPEIPVALLGAQLVGVASAINYLLNIETIADLLRGLAIRENALLEIGRIFGPSIEAKVEVERDDKLRTVVTIAVGSGDEALRAQLTADLSRLPQTYVLPPAEKQGSADGDD